MKALRWWRVCNPNDSKASTASKGLRTQPSNLNETFERSDKAENSGKLFVRDDNDSLSSKPSSEEQPLQGSEKKPLQGSENPNLARSLKQILHKLCQRLLLFKTQAEQTNNFNKPTNQHNKIEPRLYAIFESYEYAFRIQSILMSTSHSVRPPRAERTIDVAKLSFNDDSKSKSDVARGLNLTCRPDEVPYIFLRANFLAYLEAFKRNMYEIRDFFERSFERSEKAHAQTVWEKASTYVEMSIFFRLYERSLLQTTVSAECSDEIKPANKLRTLFFVGLDRLGELESAISTRTWFGKILITFMTISSLIFFGMLLLLLFYHTQFIPNMELTRGVNLHSLIWCILGLCLGLFALIAFNPLTIEERIELFRHNTIRTIQNAWLNHLSHQWLRVVSMLVTLLDENVERTSSIDEEVKPPPPPNLQGYSYVQQNALLKRVFGPIDVDAEYRQLVDALKKHNASADAGAAKLLEEHQVRRRRMIALGSGVAVGYLVYEIGEHVLSYTDLVHKFDMQSYLHKLATAQHTGVRATDGYVAKVHHDLLLDQSVLIAISLVAAVVVGLFAERQPFGRSNEHGPHG